MSLKRVLWEIQEINLSKHPFKDEYNVNFLLNDFSYLMVLQPNNIGLYSPFKVYHYLNANGKCDMCQKGNLEECTFLTDHIDDLFVDIRNHRKVRLRFLVNIPVQT